MHAPPVNIGFLISAMSGLLSSFQTSTCSHQYLDYNSCAPSSYLPRVHSLPTLQYTTGHSYSSLFLSSDPDCSVNRRTHLLFRRFYQTSVRMSHTVKLRVSYFPSSLCVRHVTNGLPVQTGPCLHHWNHKSAQVPAPVSPCSSDRWVFLCRSDRITSFPGSLFTAVPTWVDNDQGRQLSRSLMWQTSHLQSASQQKHINEFQSKNTRYWRDVYVIIAKQNSWFMYDTLPGFFCLIALILAILFCVSNHFPPPRLWPLPLLVWTRSASSPDPAGCFPPPSRCASPSVWRKLTPLSDCQTALTPSESLFTVLAFFLLQVQVFFPCVSSFCI